MPDWFYRTVSRPLLFRLPAPTARGIALGLMGQLARVPLGPAVIDFLGHMGADPRLRCEHRGIIFPSPIGLGPALDANAVALPALARFGFGFLDVGPITREPWPDASPVERREDQEAIWQSARCQNAGLAALEPRLIEASRLGLPLLVRLAAELRATPDETVDACRIMAGRLAPYVAVFVLATVRCAEAWSDAAWERHVHRVADAVRTATPVRPLLVAVPADLAAADAQRLVEVVRTAGVDGFLVDGMVAASGPGVLSGAPAHNPALEQVRRIRQQIGPELLLVAAGGIHEPWQALEMRRAGANLIQLDTGLVYSGPGLPKRVNEALLADAPCSPIPPPLKPAAMSWLWLLLMGLGMFIGGVMALAIAATRVVLPYDEAFSGMSREELAAVNPRLLAFMAHDRVTLAGTMIAIGILYVALSQFGVRRGLHWAQHSIAISAFSGFGSFFLFLGFGYFDPFHAFVTTVLFQFLLLGVHSELGVAAPNPSPDVREDGRWRLGLWGQFVMILHACGLLAAGTAISFIGCTWVFVHEDLEFMQTTAEALRAANPRLVPLVAHDRACFGGMLIASGLTLLTASLWGYRRGAPWLWWTFALAGPAAYIPTLAVHYAVGYTDLDHLIPAFAGLGLYLLGLGLSYPYLGATDGEPR